MRFLCFVLLWMLSCSTSWLAAYSQTAPWNDSDVSIFVSPWLRADTNLTRGGERVPPYETIDFADCAKPLLGDGSEDQSFGLLAPQKQIFEASISEAEQAFGDLHIFPQRRTHMALFENRMFGGAPRTEIFGDLTGYKYPNGVILVQATHFRNLSVENDELIQENLEPPIQAHMVQRPVRESDGKIYYQLITNVTANGQATNDSRLYYSCVLPSSIE